MKFNQAALIIPFSFIGLLLIGNERVFADDPAHFQEPIDGLPGSVESKMEPVKKPIEPLKTKQELANSPTPSSVDSEIQVKKPLDLTFTPDFPENPFPNNGKGKFSVHEMSDLFTEKKKNSAVKFSGELLKAEKEEQGKIRPVDGAGIRIELNPK